MSNSDVFKPPLERRLWPLGQHTIVEMRPFPGLEETRWIVFKLAAAEWYLDTLKALAYETGALDRYFGVELALDGFRAAVSSSFDAAVASLIEALESSAPDDKKTPPHLYKWKVCKRLRADQSIALHCESEVDAALSGETKRVPTGWLAVARRMRNQSTHHSMLSRHFETTINDPVDSGTSSSRSEPIRLSLPAGGSVEPIQWCEHTLDQSRMLARLMSSDLASIRPWEGG